MTHLTFWLLILFAGIGVSWGRSEAHLLILESSDQHSSYDQIARFVREIYQQRRQFLEKHPKDKVVLVINGDFSGLSEFAIDDGNFNYEMLTRLAHDFELVVNIGNHEGFDWDGADGNRLFLAQNSKLVREISRVQEKPFFLTNANLPPGPEGTGLVRPFRDIPLAEGKSVRFVGLVLRDFFKRSNYGVGKTPRIFSGKVLDPVETSLAQLRNAQKDGVATVVLTAHDGYTNLSLDLEEIKKRIARESVPLSLLPVAFAAHDHLRYQGKVGDTVLLDAGHGYSFHSVILNNEGEVVEVGHTAGSQHALLPPAFQNRREEWIFRESRRLVERSQALHRRVLAQLPAPIHETRRTLQAGRCRLGNALADSLVDWAKGELAKKRPGENYTVLAFYNSSSYRGETSIPSGSITGGTIWRAYPFRSIPRVALVRGSDIPQLFRSLRDYRLQTESNPLRQYTPQLSSNLVEGEDGELFYKLGPIPEALNPDQIYAVAMDGWLANNKYGVPKWNELKDRMEWLEHESVLQTEVLARHLPKRLIEISGSSQSCARDTANGATP